MSKEKQIEEMAHSLCGQKYSCSECDSDYRCEFLIESSILHKAGYRKQSEGEWEEDYSFVRYRRHFHCSNCGYYVEILHNFCPKCGVKMKGGAE